MGNRALGNEIVHHVKDNLDFFMGYAMGLFLGNRALGNEIVHHVKDNLDFFMGYAMGLFAAPI